MVGLPDGEKNFKDMCNRLHTIPACDRRADVQTDRHTLRAAKTPCPRKISLKSAIGCRVMAKNVFKMVTIPPNMKIYKIKDGGLEFYQFS